MLNTFNSPEKRCFYACSSDDTASKIIGLDKVSLLPCGVVYCGAETE